MLTDYLTEYTLVENFRLSLIQHLINLVVI